MGEKWEGNAKKQESPKLKHSRYISTCFLRKSCWVQEDSDEWADRVCGHLVRVEVCTHARVLFQKWQTSDNNLGSFALRVAHNLFRNNTNKWQFSLFYQSRTIEALANHDFSWFRSYWQLSDNYYYIIIFCTIEVLKYHIMRIKLLWHLRWQLSLGFSKTHNLSLIRVHLIIRVIVFLIVT